MLGWALAAAVGALAGALVDPGHDRRSVPSSMQSILVFSFAAAALGGFDSPLGAVVGGLIVGVAESLTTQYIHALHDIELVVPFGLILLVLLVRPSGLFGTDARGAGVMPTAVATRASSALVVRGRGRRVVFGWYIPQFYEPDQHVPLGRRRSTSGSPRWASTCSPATTARCRSGTARSSASARTRPRS